MTDMEEMINHLQIIRTWAVVDRNYGGINSDCCDDIVKWIDEALKLLKEQKPVEPNGENCGECGYTLHRILYDSPDKDLRHEWFRFCPSCGKAVKWDELYREN